MMDQASRVAKVAPRVEGEEEKAVPGKAAKITGRVRRGREPPRVGRHRLFLEQRCVPS